MAATLVIVIEKSGPDMLIELPETVLAAIDSGWPIRVTDATLLPEIVTTMSDLAPKEPPHRPSQSTGCCAGVGVDGFEGAAEGVVPAGLVCDRGGEMKANDNTTDKAI